MAPAISDPADPSPDLATVLTEAARAVHTAGSLEETLHTIVTVLRDTLPEIDHVGITLVHRKGSLETAAGTDPFVETLDRLQYDVGEGPCLTALEDGRPDTVLVEHARHEGRWHEFIPGAVAHGLRSQLGVRMFVNDHTVGVLNLYSTSHDEIGADSRHLAELFATHAALAYGHSRKLDDLAGAVESRQVIGQATGIVMERYGVGPDRAFEYLVRVSGTTETKLRDVARELVEGFGADRLEKAEPNGRPGP